MHTRSQILSESIKATVNNFIPIIRTRSQKKNEVEKEPLVSERRSKRIENLPKPIYDVDIDFDGASKAWLRNKRRIGNGCYEYK
jgi:hypothetical protein